MKIKKKPDASHAVRKPWWTVDCGRAAPQSRARKKAIGRERKKTSWRGGRYFEAGTWLSWLACLLGQGGGG